MNTLRIDQLGAVARAACAPLLAPAHRALTDEAPERTFERQHAAPGDS